ncbi:MAG: 3-hydroxyacyl-ACP dehydratase FabZ [Armatimonadota bacterium]
MIDVEQIRSVIPHRYPFLLVDKIIEINEDETACVGIKNVTINEKVLNGHLPGKSIFPYPMLVEHMAQVGCYLLMKKPDSEGKIAYFAAIDEVEFKKPVVPGDTITTKVELITGRRGIWRIKAESELMESLSAVEISLVH